MIKAIQLDLGNEFRGGQRQVLYLVRYLKRTGRFAPVIAAPKGAPIIAKARVEGVECVELPGRREWSLGNFRVLNRLLAESGSVHILHTHDARAAALGGLLKLLSNVRFRLVHSRRVSYPLKGWWSAEKYRLGDAVVAVSAEIRDVVVVGGVDAEKASVIHSGIDVTLYPLKEGQGAPLVVGFLGALTPQKGCSVFLQALKALQEMADLPSWRAVVVGEGRLRKDLERQVQALGIADRVRFLGWRESRDVMPAMDILAVPSVDGEGSSGVVKEAWAVGIPLVVSDLPSNLELVEDRVSGVVVRRGDAESLAQGLSGLLKEAGLREKLTEEGKRRVMSFTDEVMARSYLELYESFYK